MMVTQDIRSTPKLNWKCQYVFRINMCNILKWWGVFLVSGNNDFFLILKLRNRNGLQGCSYRFGGLEGSFPQGTLTFISWYIKCPSPPSISFTKQNWLLRSILGFSLCLGAKEHFQTAHSCPTLPLAMPLIVWLYLAYMVEDLYNSRAK